MAAPEAKRRRHKPPQRVVATRSLLPAEVTGVLGEFCGTFGNHLAKVRDTEVRKWATDLGDDFRKSAESENIYNPVLTKLYTIKYPRSAAYTEFGDEALLEFLTKTRTRELSQQIPGAVFGDCGSLHDKLRITLLRPEAMVKGFLWKCEVRAMEGYDSYCTEYGFTIPGPWILSQQWRQPEKHDWEGEGCRAVVKPCSDPRCGPTYCLECFASEVKRLLNQWWGPTVGGCLDDGGCAVLECQGAGEKGKLHVRIPRGQPQEGLGGVEVDIRFYASW